MDGQVQKWNLSQAPPQYQQQLRYQEEAQPTALTALNKDASLALIGNSHFLFTYFSISEFQLFVFNLLILPYRFQQWVHLAPQKWHQNQISTFNE